MAETSTVTHLHLREVADSDLPTFFEQQRDPVSVAMGGVPARDYDAFMAHWAKIRLDPDTILRTIEVDGQIAGNTLSFVHDGKRQVGYWLGQQFWGRGIASRALADLLTIVTDRPLYATVSIGNVASRRVLEKHGFTVYSELGDPDPVYLLILPAPE